MEDITARRVGPHGNPDGRPELAYALARILA
jgi:hypothetical protein